MSKGKFFELLDFPKFAAPDVLKLAPEATARALVERLSGASFMSYGAMWPRMDLLVRGLASDDFIRSNFSFYADDWKNKSIRSAFLSTQERGSHFRLMTFDFSRGEFTSYIA